MSNIKNAISLLYSAWYWQLDDIKNVMVDLLQEWAEQSQLWAKQEQQYETERARLFIEYKTLKREKKTAWNDRELEIIAKSKAMTEYKTTIAYARVLKEYLDMLKSLKIDLMHQQKNLDI